MRVVGIRAVGFRMIAGQGFQPSGLKKVFCLKVTLHGILIKVLCPRRGRYRHGSPSVCSRILGHGLAQNPKPSTLAPNPIGVLGLWLELRLVRVLRLEN